MTYSLFNIPAVLLSNTISIGFKSKTRVKFLTVTFPTNYISLASCQCVKNELVCIFPKIVHVFLSTEPRRVSSIGFLFSLMINTASFTGLKVVRALIALYLSSNEIILYLKKFIYSSAESACYDYLSSTSIKTLSPTKDIRLHACEGLRFFTVSNTAF